jgi:hypothetical protein
MALCQAAFHQSSAHSLHCLTKFWDALSATVVTETHREAVENLINLSSARVIAQHAASFSRIAHAWQVVIFWTAKVHRAAKFGVFCCVLTPFRRFDTIWADQEIAQESGELIYGPRRHIA